MRREFLYLALAAILFVVLFSQVETMIARGSRLTTAPAGDDGNVPVSPHDLAVQASDVTGDEVSDDDYGLARMLASEEPNADYVTKVALAWVCVNDSQSFGGIVAVLTYSSSAAHKGSYGTQTGRRYSTRSDPHEGELEVARRVRGGMEPDITSGAVNFFRPVVQDLLFAEGKVSRTSDQVDAEWTSAGKERVTVPGADPNIWFYRKVG
jgi:hypothetical protein